MKKTVLIVALMMASLTACGAENVTDATDKAKATADTALNSVRETTEKMVNKTKTIVSAEAKAALSAMSPENGLDNFDAAGIISAGDGKFVAGTDYEVLTPTQPTSSDPSVVEVAEVFMYSCPHCYSLEPFMKDWLKRKPVGVNFIRLPAQFNKPAQMHATAYYVAQALGVSEQLHVPFFKAIHTDRNPLSSQKAIKELFEQNGVDGDEFDKHYTSFEVDTKLRQSQNLAMRYKIASVPTLIINGKYKTSGSMAKSNQRLNDIIDYLVAKELIE